MSDDNMDPMDPATDAPATDMPEATPEAPMETPVAPEMPAEEVAAEQPMAAPEAPAMPEETPETPAE